MSGLIYVVILGMWAAYLVPRMLRHHDELVDSRSADRFSDTARVLVTRSGSSSIRRQADRAELSTPARPPRPVTTSDRRARSAALVRRRRLLLGLAGLTALAAAAAAWTPQLWWIPVLPSLLMTGYLVHLRRRARCRSTTRPLRPTVDRYDAAPVPQSPAVVPEPASASPASNSGTPSSTVAQPPPQANAASQPRSGAVDRPVAEPQASLPATKQRSRVGHGDVWDPVAVTLPTYVTKPKALAPKGSIDLSKPGAWTAAIEKAESSRPGGAETAATGRPAAGDGAAKNNGSTPRRVVNE